MVEFQHAAARRRLVNIRIQRLINARFNTQPPEGGWRTPRSPATSLCGFNTQPPEGGWMPAKAALKVFCMFQHAAARRRLDLRWYGAAPARQFQHAAARRRLDRMTTPKSKKNWFQHAAARRRLGPYWLFSAYLLGFNTQPPEGGWVFFARTVIRLIVSTRSRPKAAGKC